MESISQVAYRVLSDKGCTMVHCFGGCGRSGIALLRLMCEAGEAPDHALERLERSAPLRSRN